MERALQKLSPAGKQTADSKRISECCSLFEKKLQERCYSKGRRSNATSLRRKFQLAPATRQFVRRRTSGDVQLTLPLPACPKIARRLSSHPVGQEKCGRMCPLEGRDGQCECCPS